LLKFYIEILEYIPASYKHILIERKQYYFELIPLKYNINPTAGSPLGAKYSKETRKKISASNLGDKHPFFGKILSKKTKKKLSLIKSGKVFSLETRKKMSEAQLDEKHQFLGKTHSEKMKKKLV